MNHKNNAIFFFVVSAIGLASAWYFNAMAVMLAENYIVASFVTAFSFVFPLFLGFRELALAKQESSDSAVS